MLIGKDSVKIVNRKAVKISNKQPYSGEFKEFYLGNLKFRGNYKNGKKQDEFDYYNLNEYSIKSGGLQLDSTVNFRDGKREGKKIIYHEMSMTTGGYYIKAIEYYKNDVLNGVCDYWDFSGQIAKTKVYKKGVLIKEMNYTLDTNIYLIDFRIIGSYKEIGSSAETISRSPHQSIDSALTQYKTASLTKRGYKVKSYSISFDCKGCSDYSFSTHKKTGFAIPFVDYSRHYSLVKIYIDYLVLVDPNGKEYTLPGKRFIYSIDYR
jgi:hypothetical protein